MRSFALLALLVLGLSCHLAFAQAQATTGVIEGTVIDSNGEPLPGAVVVLRNTGTNYEKNLVTDVNGRFRGLLMPLGPYEVRITSGGMAAHIKGGYQVTVGRTVDASAKLQPESVQEVIQAVVEKQAVEITKIESSTSIDVEAIKGLPNNGRNFLDFSTLTPGVTIAQGPDGAVISINGQKGIQNNIAVDGADFNNPFFGEQRGGQRAAFTFNMDAVQEVVVVGDGAPAEFGRSSAGFINVITKSGTNQVKGSAHTFFRNDSLSARGQNPNGSKDPEFSYEKTQVGFTLGGPLIKDRLFYFLSFDLQSGDSTKQTDPNRIEQRVVDYFESIGIHQENAPIERSDDAMAVSAKLDWNLNENNLLTLRLSHTKTDQKNGTFDVDSWGASANAVEKGSSYAFSGQLNTVISPSVINEMRFQYAREERPREYEGDDIAGSSRPLPDTAFDFGRSYRFGQPFFIPVSYHDTRLQINNNLSIIGLSHVVKMGVEYNLTRAAQTFVGFANGRWIFSSTDGFLNYVENPNYVECSDGSSNFNGTCPEGTTIVGPVLLYLQQAGVGGLSVEESGTQTIEQAEPALFIQDKWDLSPTLTIQYGLRWEAQIQPDPITPASEVFYAPFIGTTRNGQEFPSDGEIPSDMKMFQPRFGLTWDPFGDAKTAVRFTSGLYYARIPGLALASSRSTNGSRGQTVFRNSELRHILGPTPAYPDLIPVSTLGDPQFPSVFVFDKDFRNPQSWVTSATIERELKPGFSGFFKATWIEGKYQTRFINRNAAALGSPWSSGLGADGSNGIADLTVVESIGESRYVGYTLGWNKVLSKGFQWQGNYTYSKDKSDDDNERDPFSYRYADVTRLDADWGWSDRDQRHRASTWLTYAGPWGIDANMRWTYRSATPKSLKADGTDANSPSDRVNADGSITPRNIGRKDNTYNSIDFRFAKTFKFQGFSLEAALDVFNAANNKNLLQPQVTNLVFNFDGTVQSGAGSPRQAQLGLRALF